MAGSCPASNKVIVGAADCGFMGGSDVKVVGRRVRVAGESVSVAIRFGR